MWRELLERRDHREAQRMLQESQLSVSGLLLRVGAYRRCPQLPATGSLCAASAESGCWSPQLVRTFPDVDLELIKQVWDRNADQVRHKHSHALAVVSGNDHQIQRRKCAYINAKSGLMVVYCFS
jgi:hypothetical protein